MSERWDGHERPRVHNEDLELHVRALESGYARPLEQTPEESRTMVEHLAGCEVCRTRYLEVIAEARFAKNFAETNYEWAQLMGSCLAMDALGKSNAQSAEGAQSDGSDDARQESDHEQL